MLTKGVEHLIGNGLAGLAQAWDMASVRPAGFMGLATAEGLAVGAPADLVLFRREGSSFHVERTYKAGDVVGS
jgi:N-acetylglucosamine-6-phosphate deacetylase